MDQKIKALQVMFPDAGITGGYIGNCGCNSYGAFDDRRWMIFTKVKQTGNVNRVSLDISGPEFDLADTAAKLGALLARVRVSETAIRPLKSVDAFIAGEYSRHE